MGMFDGLFGGSSSGTRDAQKYLAQMQPMLEKYYNPYIERGAAAGTTLDEQYARLLNNPAAVQQMLGSSYQQSPGYQYQMNEAMNAANQAAAAGGLLGTSAHQKQAMGGAQGLANQDYWNYYNQNANLYGKGLAGTQGMFDTGFNATNQMTQGLGNMYGSQANLAYTNQQNQNQALSSLLGAGIGATGYVLGGPIGGMAAQGMSNWFKPGVGA